MVERTVYVENINPLVDDDILQQFFSCCGKISAFKSVGQASGPTRFAFVEYEDVSSVQAALHLDNTQLVDRYLRISQAKSSISATPLVIADPTLTTTISANAVANRTIKVTNIDNGLTESSIREFFQLSGPILRMKITPDGETLSALIEYSTPDGATQAVNLSNDTMLGDRKLSVEKTTEIIDSSIQPQTGAVPYGVDRREELIYRTVHVSGIELDVTEEQIQKFFNQTVGTVMRVRLAGSVIPGGTRFAFVEFATVDMARSALAMSGLLLNGTRLRINQSKTAIFGVPFVTTGTAAAVPISTSAHAARPIEWSDEESDYDDRRRRRDRDRSRKRSRSRDRSRDRDRSRERRRSRDRDRKRSRSRDRDRGRSRKRSRSRERRRSRDRDRKRSRSRDRDRGRSRKRSRSKDRGRSRKRSRSRDRGRSRDRSRKRSRSREKRRHRSRSRSRSGKHDKKRDLKDEPSKTDPQTQDSKEDEKTAAENQNPTEEPDVPKNSNTIEDVD